jgi:hypothetical protein
VLGLMRHAAEHATRHVGQATTTARIPEGIRHQESGIRPVSGIRTDALDSPDA